MIRCAVLPATGLAAFGLAIALLAPASAEASESCTAMPVSEAIAKGASDDCIAVQAWEVDGQLMDDPIHRYAAERRYNEPSSSGVQLGFDAGREDAAQSAGTGSGGAALLQVRGTVRLCAEQASGALLPQSGQGNFCDTSRGLYLEAEETKFMQQVPIMRATAATGKGLGNLSRLQDAALAGEMRAWYQSLIQQHRAGGGELAKLSSDAEVEIFGWRTPDWADFAEQQSLSDQAKLAPEAIACAMDQRQAAGNLWPISTRDIGLANGRPYICARVISEDGEYAAEFRDDPYPAQEPR